MLYNHNIIVMSKSRMFGRYQIEGLEDQEVMKREEEANFHHIETDNGDDLSLVYECEWKSTRFIFNILSFFV